MAGGALYRHREQLRVDALVAISTIGLAFDPQLRDFGAQVVGQIKARGFAERRAVALVEGNAAAHREQVAQRDRIEARIVAPQFGQVAGHRVVDTGDAAFGDPNAEQ